MRGIQMKLSYLAPSWSESFSETVAKLMQMILYWNIHIVK